MSVLILHENDESALSSKTIKSIQRNAKLAYRYNDKIVYLFDIPQLQFSNTIYEKIVKKNKKKCSKIMSILFLGKNYQEAKTLYRDILVSWIV